MKKTYETLITAHNNADFDCLSSMVAAQKLYPNSTIIFPPSQEQSLKDFLLQSALYLFDFSSLKDVDLDSVKRLVVCDTRQRNRISHIQELLDKKKNDLEIHIYDHHPDSDDDISGDLEVIRPWGATVSILVSLLKERNVNITSEEASIIGLGLYEDTGCFTFSSTTEHDLLACAWLLKQGMDVNFISEFLNKDFSSEQVFILNKLLESASRHNINGVEVCITQISSDHYIKDLAVLIHKMMEIENIKVLFALATMQDKTYVIARSKTKTINVGEICASLGGGGHRFAASATIKDKTLNQVRDDIFALLYSHINPQLRVKSLMSVPPIFIRKKARISQATSLMTHFGLKAVPVVEDEKKKDCIGVLEFQLAEKAKSHGLGDWAVEEYMMRNFDTVSPEDNLYKVVEIIIDRGQRLVPVIEDGKLVGVITRTDIINWLVEEPARIPDDLFPEKRHEKNLKPLMKTRLPSKIYNLLETLGKLAHEKGFKVYVVGGFVRDILLNRPNLDIDVVVEGDGIEFASHITKVLGGRFRPHKKFKTAVVILPDDQRIDVATARLEYYEYPAALPTVELSSIKMDLFRRDFTINALAIELNPNRFGLLVDFFGGQKDIKEKRIRVLHSLSFIDDPTRIIRAVRFEQRFNFKIGPQTERLIKNAIKLNMFQKLSGSRIFQEFKLVFEEESVIECIKRMASLKILESIHPVLKLTIKKQRLFEDIKKVMDWYFLSYKAPTPELWKVYFLGFCWGEDEKGIESLSERVNLTKRQRESFLELIQYVKDVNIKLYRWIKKKGRLSELYFILNPVPIEALLFVMAFNRNKDVKKHISFYIQNLKQEEPDITGKDLINMGIPPGPIYGHILKEVLRAKIDGEAKDRQTQLELVTKLVS